MAKARAVLDSSLRSRKGRELAGGGPVITLIDIPVSPYAQKVKLALLEKGLAFETTVVDLTLPSQELHALNPRGEVPALRDGDVVVCDSSVILAYLEDAYPEPALLPATAEERARVRELEKLCDGAYEPVVWGVAELTWFQRASGELKESLLERAAEQVGSLNARLEAQLQTRAWLNGESFGFGDIVAYPSVSAAATQGNAPASGSRLDGWLRTMRQRPSAQRVKQDVLATMEKFSAVPRRIASGEAKRQYRDHRLEWMLRSGGLEIVLAGLQANNIRFSNAV